MRRPGMWWIGLAPALALWLALIQLETQPFEQKLAARADAVLREKLGETASAEAQGRDVSLRGLIFDETARSEARDAVAALQGVRRVSDGLTPPPALAPYVWSAVWDGSALSLSGGAPTPADRAALLAAAKRAFPQARIDDQMIYASGAPTGFAAAAAGSLPALAHLQSGEARWLGGELSLSGQAATDEAYRSALALAATAGYAIKTALSPSRPAVFAFAAENDGKTLRLSGVVGSDADRVMLLGQARRLFPDVTVMDGLEVVSGAPPQFSAEAVFALRALAQLKSGRVSLGDHQARLSGVAPHGVDVSGVIAALGPSPGVKIDASGVVAGEIAPYALAMEKSGRNVSLTGCCGDAESCARIRAAARQAFAGLTLIDSMREGAGAPPGFVAAALGGLGQLVRLREGRFALRDSSAELRGDAAPATAEAVTSDFIAAMPDGFAVHADIVGSKGEEAGADPAAPPLAPEPAAPREPAAGAEAQPSPQHERPAEACKLRLGALASTIVIRFDYASAGLGVDDARALEGLAAEALKCPQARLEISGHSDDLGSIPHNFDWSWRRAETVAAFLLAAGVAPDRLRIEGFGETAPLAPNDSDENRARNRRIEIQVK